MKLRLLFLFAILFTLQTNAQTLNPTFNISNAGAANVFKGGYTFSYAVAGTPWNGALISFGGFSNQYDCQISTDYGPNGGNHISYRTRNGDISQWNSWNELATRGINTFNGNQNVNGELKISSYSPLLVLQRDTNVGGFIQGIQTKNLDNTDNWFFGNLQPNSWVVSKGDFNNAKFTILDNGNVGIGTTNPDQKLTVKGKIHTEEIIVDLAVPADYVFQKYYTGKSELKPDYTMPTLAEIENFTRKNNHLPNVPSAKEIQQNGLLLGTMSNILLQKVEELMLYVIEQNKELKIQKTQLQLQNDKIILLENKIESNELCPLKN